MVNLPTTQKPSVTVLVIDDQRDRDPVYTTFFSRLEQHESFPLHINLSIAQSPTDVIAILSKREADFVLLDMMFDDVWTGHRAAILSAIVRSQLPVALVSLDFSQDAAIESMRLAIASLTRNRLLGFFSYSLSIRRYCIDANGQPINSRIENGEVSAWISILSFATSQNLSWRLRESGKLVLLHLTDTHFGRVAPDLLNMADIGLCARKHGLVADALAWTGDVTNSGLPIEFDAAKQFLASLYSEGLVDRQSPVFVVPGNHDLCWPLALASRLHFQTFEDATGDGSKKRWVVTEESRANAPLWTFGFEPYREFFNSVVGEEAPTVAKGFRWSAQWRHLGFAVLELPIESHVVRSHTEHRTAAPFVSDADFNRIVDAAWQTVKDAALPTNVCVIVMPHGRDPNLNDGPQKRWSKLLDLIGKRGNPVIVVAGHEHQNIAVSQGKVLTVVGVPHDEMADLDRLTLPSVQFVRLRGGPRI